MSAPRTWTETSCSVCKQTLPISLFRWIEKRSDGRKPCWTSYCKPCEAKRQSERRAKVPDDAPKPPKPERGTCIRCDREVPGEEFIYVKTSAAFRLRRECRKCRSDDAKAWRENNKERARERARRYHKELRARASLVRENTPNVDVLRKALVEQPVGMQSEAELVAYFRGFVAGAKRESHESGRFERLKDLVHRIAAESNTARGIGYEDAVSYGYEGLLVFLRKRVPSKNEEHERRLAAQAIRWAITDAKREFGGLRRDGKQRFPMPESSFVRPDESLPTEGVQDRSGDEPVLPEAVESIEIDPRDRRVLEGLVAGMTFDEAGALVGLTGSRVSQRLKDLGRQHPDLERVLLASV